MSQSDARRARRDCKRAGRHLMVKTDGVGHRWCVHCNTDMPVPPKRGMLTPKMTRP